MSDQPNPNLVLAAPTTNFKNAKYMKSLSRNSRYFLCVIYLYSQEAETSGASKDQSRLSKVRMQQRVRPFGRSLETPANARYTMQVRDKEVVTGYERTECSYGWLGWERLVILIPHVSEE
jgi:hypothetical protein